MTDQQRTDTLGILGETPCRTPNLDRVAREGVVFGNAQTPTPLCSPARAAILTGRYPHSNGCVGNCQQPEGGSNTGLPDLSPDEKTLSELLTPAGVACAYSGKWHLGRETERQRDYRMFMSHRDPSYLQGLQARGLDWDEMGVFEDLHYRDGALFCGTSPLPANENRDAFVAGNAVNMLDKMAGGKEPFALWCSFYGPHQPFSVPAPWDGMYDPKDIPLPPNFGDEGAGMPAHMRHTRVDHKTFRLDEDAWRRIIAHYWGYVSFLDAQFGRVLDRLQEHGLWDDTAIVMLSDHGEMLGGRRLFGKDLHFANELMRTPRMMKIPGMPGGRIERGLVSLVDVVPTMLDAFGVNIPANIQGRSLWKALADGQPCGADAVFGEHCARIEPSKIGCAGRMIRTERQKYCMYTTGEEELYDLQSDPFETRNLATTCDPMLGELRARLEQWMQWTHDEYPVLPDFLRG